MLRSADRSTSSLSRRKAAKPGPVTYGDALPEVEGDHVIKTDPQENSRRRTIVLEKRDNSWGFTLQSYGIHSRRRNEVNLLTYVDYVEIGSAAFEAGLRPGDVILSVNGISVENVEHAALVNFIRSCGNVMRMVVLFEDCCRKVELHARHLKLKKMLNEKLFELRALEDLEHHILGGKNLNAAAHLSLASSMTSLDTSASMECVSLCPELDVCSYFDRRRMGSHSLLPRSERFTPVLHHVAGASDYGSLPLRGEKARRARALAVVSTPSPYARGSSSSGRLNGFHGGSSHSLGMGGMPLSPEHSGVFEPALFSMTSISEVDGDENVATFSAEPAESSTDLKPVATDLNASATSAQEYLSSEGSSARNSQSFAFDSQASLCVTPECIRRRNTLDIHSVSSPIAFGESILPESLAIDGQSLGRNGSSRDVPSISSYALNISSHSGLHTPQASMRSARLYVGSPPLSPRASDSRRQILTRTQSRDSRRSSNNSQKHALTTNNTSSLSSFISQKISSHFRDLGNTLADGGKSKNSFDTPQLLHFRRIYSDVLPSYLNMQPASQSIEKILRASSKSLPDTRSVVALPSQENVCVCASCGQLGCVCILYQNGHSTAAVSPDKIASPTLDIGNPDFVQNNGNTFVISETSDGTCVIPDVPNDTIVIQNVPDGTNLIPEIATNTCMTSDLPNNSQNALDDVVIHVNGRQDADEHGDDTKESPDSSYDGSVALVNGSHDDEYEHPNEKLDNSLATSQITCGLMQHEVINEEDADTYL